MNRSESFHGYASLKSSACSRELDLGKTLISAASFIEKERHLFTYGAMDASNASAAESEEMYLPS
jgi:hypothetical protein